MVLHFDMCIMLTLAIGCFWTPHVAARKFCLKGLGCIDISKPFKGIPNPFEARKVCYEGLDCFDTKLRCNAVVKLLPQSPSKINTEFYLYTRENPEIHQVIDWTDDDSIVNSNFKGSRETKFLIHGFTDKILNPTYKKMKDALLEVGDFNVILVNWERGATAAVAAGVADISNLKDLFLNVLKLPKFPKEYLQARQNTRLVGRQIGELARKLKKLTQASFPSMHLIGHSLGAQVAGYAGEHLSGKIGRITGLDPAGPGYELFSSSPGCLLEKSDARFVDIIHTDDVVGIQKAVGHQDFYPSGGRNQVSCPRKDLACDHTRAVDFFIESITSKCEWLAYPCSSWILYMAGACRHCHGNRPGGCPRMGFFADPSKGTGKYMLATNKKKPFCKEGYN